MSRLTKYEMETVINYNAKEKTVKIYSSIPNDIKKLDALCERYPDFYHLVKEDSVSKTYECERKRLIKFTKPVILSEEQKNTLRQRFLKNKQ